jgi:hypothetical protein
VRCDHPLPPQTDGANEVQVSDYEDLALVGTIVTFSCLSGLPDMVLTGPNTSTCTGNGEWEPDPMDATCKGTRNCRIIILTECDFTDCSHTANCSIPVVNGSISFNYSSTLEGSLLQFSCNDRILIAECQSDGNWNPDPYNACFVSSSF